MKKSTLLKFIPLLTAMPAIAIGAVTMAYHKVSDVIWLQNIACLMLGGIISFLVLSRKTRNNKFSGFFIIVPIILLILTFIDTGMNGIHRWVLIGAVRLNVSMLILPLTILLLWELLNISAWWFTAVTTVIISIMLLFQPDASQLTGFAIPMLLMLCRRTDKNILRLMVILIFSALVILTWMFLDSLPPVDYVEGIISLLLNMGYIWFALGVISLLILPTIFIVFSPRRHRLPSIYIGLYYMIIMLSTLFGNFPVPLMGYGISPIIGYFIAIIWYTKAKLNT